eukprot:symbB.v1.2.005151.t1/scaffold297.1/size245286/4
MEHRSESLKFPIPQLCDTFNLLGHCKGANFGKPPLESYQKIRALSILSPLFGILVAAQVLTGMVMSELSMPGGSELFRSQDIVEQGLGGLLHELREKKVYVMEARGTV